LKNDLPSFAMVAHRNGNESSKPQPYLLSINKRHCPVVASAGATLHCEKGLLTGLNLLKTALNSAA